MVCGNGLLSQIIWGDVSRVESEGRRVRMNTTSRKGNSNPKAKLGNLSKGKNFESKKTFETSASYLSSLSEMLVNPAECSAIVKTPADFAMTGDVKCFTRTFQLKASDLSDQNFAMTLSPSIEGFFSVSAAAPLVCAAGGRGNGDGLSPNEQGGVYYLTGKVDLYNAVDPQAPPTHSISSQQFQGKLAYHVSAGPGSVFNIAASCSAGKPDMFIVWFYDGVTFTWLNMGTYPVRPGTNYVPFTVPGGVNLEAIAIECRSTTASTILDVIFPAGCSMPQDSQLHSLYSSDAVLIGKVERWRVTAMSMKVSYSGNMLNNGGVIAAARTQPQYSFNDVPYDALTKLQDHKYQGPMVEGAYVWWLPYSYQEMDYKTNILDHSAATQLRAAGQFADASGAVVITLTCVVEFYSPLQIFSHEPSPSASDDYLQLLHALDRLPAATCNPSHTEILSGLWDKGISVAKGGVRFLLEHPEIVAKLAALFVV